VLANVLIVEDDADILSSLAEVIRDEGYEVQTAANGFQALNALERQAPDLIFLDLMMPVMDGWRFMEEVKRRFPDLQAPIVLISAMHNLTEEARKLGVRCFLPKPYDLDDVVRIADACCPKGAVRPPGNARTPPGPSRLL
jgi:two-component system nitrogen regulation response regulator NtrX